MEVSLRKFTSQTDIIDFCGVRTEIRWKMQRQMMNRSKLNNSERKKTWNLILEYLKEAQIWNEFSLNRVFQSAGNITGELKFLIGLQSCIVISHVWPILVPNEIEIDYPLCSHHYTDHFQRLFFLSYILTLSGCELSSAPMIMIPFNLILPVNGMLNNSSSSASLFTNCKWEWVNLS